MNKQFEKLRENLLGLSWAMQNPPYQRVSKKTIETVAYVIGKSLSKGTTIESLLKESVRKKE